MNTWSSTLLCPFRTFFNSTSITETTTVKPTVPTVLVINGRHYVYQIHWREITRVNANEVSIELTPTLVVQSLRSTPFHFTYHQWHSRSSRRGTTARHSSRLATRQPSNLTTASQSSRPTACQSSCCTARNPRM